MELLKSLESLADTFGIEQKEQESVFGKDKDKKKDKDKDKDKDEYENQGFLAGLIALAVQSGGLANMMEKMGNMFNHSEIQKIQEVQKKAQDEIAKIDPTNEHATKKTNEPTNELTM